MKLTDFQKRIRDKMIDRPTAKQLLMRAVYQDVRYMFGNDEDFYKAFEGAYKKVKR